MPDQGTRSPDTQASLGYLAPLLLLISLLNLSGMIATFTESPGKAPQGSTGALIYFIPAALLCFVLLLRHVRLSAFSAPLFSFALFFGVYLIEASTYSLLNGRFGPRSVDVLVVHAFELVLICTVYFWAMSLDDRLFSAALRFSKYVLLGGVLSILLSSYLPLYQGAKADRAAGFFLDANSAASAALFCLVLIMALPSRNRLWPFVQAAAALAAILMTFSRTGLLALFLLCGLFSLDRPTLRSKVLTLSAVMAAGFVVWLLIDSGLVPLDFEQTQRLADVGNMLTGDTTQKTYDPRSVLFDIGLDMIKETFPAGNGMGELHIIEYGVRHYSTGIWLGVHNTYLMILGEAGLISSLLFVAFWLLMLGRIFRPSPIRRFAVGVTIVLLFSMMTTHSVLNDKVVAVIIGLLLAAAARVPAANSTSESLAVFPYAVRT